MHVVSIMSVATADALLVGMGSALDRTSEAPGGSEIKNNLFGRSTFTDGGVRPSCIGPEDRWREDQSGD